MLNSAGRATFTTASLSRGNHAINATYGGDGNFLGSAHGNYGQAVLKDATTATTTPSANPVVVGNTLTLTATVQANAPGGGMPTGMVTFKDITTVLGTGTLNSAGQATFSTAALTVGTHAITATYGGDNNFTASVSPILAEVVNTSARTTALNSAPRNGNQGILQPVSQQANLVPDLSPQRIDDLFTSSVDRRRLESSAGAHPRRRAAQNDWLGL
jgi:hypothetical protein